MAATLDAKLRLDSAQFSQGLNEASAKAKKSADGISGAFKGLAIGAAFETGRRAIMAFNDAAVKTVMETEKFQNAMKANAGNDLLGLAQYEQLKELSARIGLNMNVAAKASLQLQASGMSSAEAMKTISVFQNAVVGTGGGAEELGRLMYGLQQLYSSPKPLAEELGQLKEALPITSKLLKEAFGTARAEDLQKLNLTGKQVAETLLKLAGDLPTVAKGMEGSFSQLNSAWQKVWTPIAQTWTSLVTGPIVELSSGALGMVSGMFSGIDDMLNRMSGVDPDKLRAAQAATLKALQDAKDAEAAKKKADEEEMARLEKLRTAQKAAAENDLAAARAFADEEKKMADEAAAEALKRLDEIKAGRAKDRAEEERLVADQKSKMDIIAQGQKSMSQAGPEEKLANVQKRLYDGSFGGNTSGGVLAEIAAAAESGAEISDSLIESYQEIVDLKAEELSLQQQITAKAKEEEQKAKALAAEKKARDTAEVKEAIGKAGMNRSERVAAMREKNDMERQEGRARRKMERDELRRLEKEGLLPTKFGKDQREELKMAAKLNVDKKWQNSLPEAEKILTAIDLKLGALAAA